MTGQKKRGKTLNIYKVEFIQGNPAENKIIEVAEGTTVLEALRMAGLSPNAPCGGTGKCGKCLVEIRDGVHSCWRKVKSCRTEVRGCLQVRTLQQEYAHRILIKGAGREVPFQPYLKVLDITIPPCRIGESTSDWDRFCMALNQAGAAGNFEPNLALLPRLSILLKEEEGRAQAVVLGNKVLDIRKIQGRAVLMAAFDIGTTSVAGYLLDGETGEQLASASALNPQTEYGADVIMRANYALERGTDELSISVRVLIKNMMRQLCRKAGKEPEEIYLVSIVGNTCMHHLFLGISPRSLVLSPYNPAIRQTLMLSAAGFRMGIHPGAQLLMLPVIAGFVGADTVACLLAVNLEEEEKMTLMIDIGTNGEIVLGNKDRRIACSTAAGPAFEGAKISCGMRGAEGAVEHARMKDGQLEYSVIGGGKACGICGSGLIDILAQLLEAGYIDKSGSLSEKSSFCENEKSVKDSCAGGASELLNGQGIIKIEGKNAWLLCKEEESGNGAPVFLSQKDIREVQLAKGAIAAGIYLLAEKMQIKLSDIEQVYIAGAFGNYMDPAGACRIGMIPPVLKDKIIPVGNAAGEGAKLALLNQEELFRAERLAFGTEFLELASMPEFQDRFIDELEFPSKEE